MTHPGIPRSQGVPLLDQAAATAIAAARERAGIGQPPRFPFPQRHALTTAERDEALKQAGTNACRLCGGLHAAPNSPACPRVRTFELNPDGMVVKGEFWQDGAYDASRVLFLADAAEEGETVSHAAGVSLTLPAEMRDPSYQRVAKLAGEPERTEVVPGLEACLSPWGSHGEGDGRVVAKFRLTPPGTGEADAARQG